MSRRLNWRLVLALAVNIALWVLITGLVALAAWCICHSFSDGVRF